MIQPQARARPSPRPGVFRIAGRTSERIVYISCDPATLVRDPRSFGQHDWRLAEGAPLDRSPHAPHIEGVAPLAWG